VAVSCCGLASHPCINKEQAATVQAGLSKKEAKGSFKRQPVPYEEDV